MALTGRVIKLVITPVIGIFDGPLLVSESPASPFVLYAHQPFDPAVHFNQVITDQAALRAAAKLPPEPAVDNPVVPNVEVKDNHDETPSGTRPPRRGNTAPSANGHRRPSAP